ncbi:HlyD family efflux transporter periplasmic adaptor subunit [Novipirellula artificiosorum]|uniref:HlyD family secretion protein n=1 Tax=Novipirellula artificiosorum TaxID=2528016 RepID=A0A5C6DZS4_9BACT|nr:HlyD family secretion protein [Novipirellula artificiosorum]TWU41714.1 HlyD family secretion protein [Novipirellula artificiosorum]
MSVYRKGIFPLLLTCLCLLSHGFADDATKNDSEQDVEITAVFESLVAVELSADSEQVDSLVIKKIVPHGTRIQPKAAVVWFETEAVDERILKAETDLSLAKLSLSESEFAFEQFGKQQDLDREAAQRTRREAKQDFDNFVAIDRQQQIESAEYQLKNAKASLEYVQEELHQLEKMYKEDELTEESEEIVLKRARRAVENAQYSLKLTETRTRRSLEQTIPSLQAKEEAKLEKAELDYAKTVQNLKDARQRRKIEQDQKKRDFEKQQADLVELREERRRFVITSPIEGIVYHGKLTRGRLSDKPSTLDTGSKATAEQVLATVVDPKRLRIRAELTETQLASLKAGIKGTATPVAFPGTELAVTIKSIESVPLASNKFDCVLSIDRRKNPAEIVPGMTCKVSFPKPIGEKENRDQREAKQNDTKKNHEDAPELNAPAVDESETKEAKK